MIPCVRCGYEMTQTQSYCPRCGKVSPQLIGQGKLYVPLDRIVPYGLALAGAGALTVVLAVLVGGGQPAAVGIGAAVFILGLISMTRYNESVAAARDYIRENAPSPEGARCGRCGAALVSGARYCSFCGSRAKERK